MLDSTRRFPTMISHIFTLQIMKPAKLCRFMGQLTGRRLPCFSLVVGWVASLQFPLLTAWTQHLLPPLSSTRAFLKPQGCTKYTNNPTLRHSGINNKCQSPNKHKTRRFLGVRPFSTSLLVLFCPLIGRHVYCLPFGSRAVHGLPL